MAALPLLVSFTALLVAQAPDWAARAREAREARDFRAAAAAYSELVRQAPGNPLLLTNLGIMQHMAGEHAQAVNALRKALQARSDVVAAHLFLGLSLLEVGQAPEAAPHLERAAGADPSGMLPRLGLARAHLAMGEIRTANDDYLRATALDPRNQEAWLGLGATYRRLLVAASARVFAAKAGRETMDRILSEESFPTTRDEMLAAEKAAAKEPPDLRGLVRLARACQALGVAALERAVGLRPESVEARLALAEMLVASARGDAAESEYAAALRIEPDSVRALLGLAILHWMSARNKEALAPLGRVLELAPENAEANGIMADILMHAGDDDKAKPHIEKALRANPNLIPVRVALARLHLAEDRADLAVPELKKALDADPDGSYHYLLAEALKRLGKAGEAEGALEQFRIRRELWRARH